jgi:gamma-glutamylputrescine oxidase
VIVGFNDGLGIADSYYVATAHPSADFATLASEIAADLVVIGGGCTGLSAALHGAERGASVVLLEGGRIGWGASGRNGGQIIPGLRKGAVGLVKAFGRERARALFDLALEARQLVLDLISRHEIDCDLKLTGHLAAAVRPADLHAMEAEARSLATVMDYPHAKLLDAREARDVVRADYHGGLMDDLGGHLHPLNYTLGLAEAARAAGVRIHENSPATGLQISQGVRISTPRGAVKAAHAVLAGDALLEGLMPRVNRRVMPVASYVIATEPLADPAALIPRDAAISDSRFVVNYYRRTSDGRLLFGGGERYSTRPPADIAAFVRPHMEAVFPQIAGATISYAWGGMVSVTTTRLPHIGVEGPVFFAHGYSGMGVVLSTLGGKLLIEAMGGDKARFGLFAAAEPPAFPGGVALRGPLHVLGMLWYAVRDRL